MLPARLLALTLYMCTSIHFNFSVFMVLSSTCFGHIQIHFKPILMLGRALKFSPPPKSPAEGHRALPVPLKLATIAFLLIMFTPGIMSVFHLIFFLAGFSDIHPGHNREKRTEK